MVAASNGGADWTPAWWLNLQAMGKGTVEVEGRRVSVRADEVSGAERERLWARLNETLDVFDG